MDDDFWHYLDQLAAEHVLVIDRPKATAHPNYPTLVYPLDYGYLDGTTTVDGCGLDVFVGSRPERRLEALALTADLHKRDAELKLLLGCTPQEQTIVLDFLNGFSMRAMLLPRPDGLMSHRSGLLDGLLSRRSVRRFSAQPVARPVLERIVQAATMAPSAHNRQPWRFAVLHSPAACQRLADALAEAHAHDLHADGLSPEAVSAQVERSRQRIRHAPAAVLLCLDPADEDRYPDALRQANERLMSVQSVALAGGTLLLAAHAEGLGGVWMCAPLFAPQAARTALALPPNWQPQALLLLGYPAAQPALRAHKGLDEVAVFYAD